MENQLNQQEKPQEKSQEKSQVKKKRGRRPKIKTGEVIIPKVLKKRGRKPKIKTEEEMKPKIPKKRGRKPKDKYGIIPQNSMNLSEFNIVEENIILHLPIKSGSVIDNAFTDKVLLEYNPIISEPQPFTKSFDNSKSDMAPYPFNNKLNTNSSEINNAYINKVYTQNNIIDEQNYIPITDNIIPISNVEDKDISDDNSDKDDIDLDKSIDNEFEINKNTNIEETYISYSDDCKINYTPIIQKLDNNNNNNKNKSNKNIFNKNNITDCKNTNLNKSLSSSTTINCFWCCHPFNKSTLCTIPYNKMNNVYHVYGSFCSPECAAAYNFDNSEDTSEIWNRYSLLNLLYKSIYSGTKIKLAPPRYVLRIFGGSLNINEFRNFNYNSKKQLHINMPPVISIIHHIEENNIEMCNSEKKKFIPLDDIRVKNAGENLRLKRSKPLSSNQKLTLVDCMRLKYV